MIESPAEDLLTKLHEPSDSLQNSLGHSLQEQSLQTATPVAVPLADGATIQAWVHPGEGTPLVFLYGLGCSISHWKYQIRHFQASGRLTVHLDYRGHGASTQGNPHRPFTVNQLVDDTHLVLKSLGIDSALVCGQSMGGSIALRLAHDYPTLVAGLILQGSPGREPFSKMRIAGGRVAKILRFLTTINRIAPRAARLLNQAAGQMPSVAREIVRLQGFNGQLAKTEDIDEYIQHFFECDPNIFYELAKDLYSFNIAKWSGTVDCPSLILAGAKDQVIPIEELKWLAKRLPASELEVFPHGSHCVHLEDPGGVNRRIGQFLETYKF